MEDYRSTKQTVDESPKEQSVDESQPEQSVGDKQYVVVRLRNMKNGVSG